MRDGVHQRDCNLGGAGGELGGGADPDAFPHRVIGAAPRPEALGLQAGACARVPAICGGSSMYFSELHVQVRHCRL